MATTPIILDDKDKARGNYLLVASGYVKHELGSDGSHIYHVSDEQKKLLEENRINYTVINS